MEIDHIFIFSEAATADELTDFGFVEGSNRIHTGQGTANRKFYFENFFLEILWVHNEEEIKNKIVRNTRLWEHSLSPKDDYSPFGLCLVNTEDTNILFEESLDYQPVYFPQGKVIEFVNSKENYLPSTFRLPFVSPKSNDEPKNHSNGIKNLTKTTFIIPKLHQNNENNYLSFFKNQSNISFQEGEQFALHLEFDNHTQQKSKEFKTLSLKLFY